MTHLFTYGSLMCSDIMSKVIGCQAEYTEATLSNFSRRSIRNEEYPGITPHSGTIVSGILYLDLSAQAIQQLDIFEGELYRRQTVTVRAEQQGQMEAMTYVIKPQYLHLLTDRDWSFSRFLKVGKKKFLKSYFGFQER